MADREGRRVIAIESPLNPESLVGSYFLRDDDNDEKYLGLVVGEVQPGAYLCEVYDFVTEQPLYQHVVELRKMMGGDEDEDWRFYDSLVEVRAAFRDWVPQ